MLAPQFSSIHNGMVKFFLNEIGFIMPSFFESNSAEAIYVQGENPGSNGSLVKVGEFFPSSNSTFLGFCKVFIWPGRYDMMEDKSNKAWGRTTENLWTDVSIFYSPHQREDADNDVESELREIKKAMEKYAEQVDYPKQLELPETAYAEERRLAKNRAILPYMLAGDSAEVASVLLSSGVKANSAVAACLRAGVITVEQVDEYQAYPKQWLEQLYPDPDVKPVSISDFFRKN